MLRLRSFLTVLVVTGTIGLTGCSMGMFPDASVNVTQGKLGTISGNDFGGHAPLVGAHVYVLQPGTSGYGSQASSLLTASYSANGAGTLYQTTANPATAGDPGIPSGWFYETTDTTGSFNISGDYTCAIGQPVYLYLYGGSPTYPSANNTFSISAVNVISRSAATNRGVTTYSYVVQFNVDQSATNPVQNFYAGEKVVISGMPTAYAFLNGTGYVTSNANLSTTTFELSTTIDDAQATAAVGQTYATTTTPELATGQQAISPDAAAVATPGLNPGVVNLATLGNCPDGTVDAGFGATIKYVYVNEVATMATAYAFQGFTAPATSITAGNWAIDIGSSGTAQSLIGIENAALTAGQLYDIQGSNLSTTYAGEGHTARTLTTAGNGQVPQTLLDYLGNILAACVDSNNTSTTIGNANISLECQTLFELATNTGIPQTATATPGVPPVDIAEAAINIARHPAGAGTAAQETSFMNGLYALPTGNVPFAPFLTAQPNDFVAGILYPASLNPTINFPEGIAVDGYGNVWFDNRSSATVDEFSPIGALKFSYADTQTPGYVAVDPSENIWFGVLLETGTMTELSNTGTVLSGTGYSGPFTGGFDQYFGYDPAIDSAGNVYAADLSTDGTQYYVTEINSSGANVTGNDPFTGSTTCMATGGNGTNGTTGAHPDHMAIDNANNGGNIWETDQVGGRVCQFSTTGTAIANFPVYTDGTSANSDAEAMEPEWIGIDSAGNAWTPNRAANSLNKITQTGTLTQPAPTGIALDGPFSAAIDGATDIWVTNRLGNSISEFNGAATTVTLLSRQTTNYTAGGIMNQPLNAQVDESGNIWMTNIGQNPGGSTTGESIVELVGAGYPVVLPLSTAQGANKLGTKP
jgi:hypothetical protein